MEKEELYKKVQNKEINISDLSIIDLVKYAEYLEEEIERLDVIINNQEKEIELLEN